VRVTHLVVDAQAELLGLTPSVALRRTQKSHPQGQCLTRDRHGRVAPVVFDYLATEIQVALSTKPKRDTPTAVPDLAGGAATDETEEIA